LGVLFEPDTISFKESAFVTMECCQQEQDIHRSSCKVSDIFVWCKKIYIFWADFRRNP